MCGADARRSAAIASTTAAKRGSVLPCATSTSGGPGKAGSDVKTALHLAGAGPTALAAGARLRARCAADRAVTLGEQRVREQPVVGDVTVDVVLGPLRERVHLDQTVRRVPLDQPNAATRLGLSPQDAGAPGEVRRKSAPQWLDLAHLAAQVGVASPQVLAVLLVLLRHRLRRAHAHQRDRQQALDRVGGAER